jgi:hypothetical protein
MVKVPDTQKDLDVYMHQFSEVSFDTKDTVVASNQLKVEAQDKAAAGVGKANLQRDSDQHPEP